jgi:murein DD-endopeptidase MepM/ murein hydrolase activator NlpD
MKRPAWLILGALLAAGLTAGGFYFFRAGGSSPRSLRVMQWIRNPQAHDDWAVHASERCGDAPFLFPTDGFIGFLWDDSWRPGQRHQGLDIFGGRQPGETPVYAAYPGYLTRLVDWKSTVIIRIPEDPLQSERQIWAYYTHMADSAGNSFISPLFPPGSVEIYVEAGTLLGYQGNFSGSPGNPTGVHLHFSLVRDDGQGKFLNELEIENTIDPSPYFNLRLNARDDPQEIPVCEPLTAAEAP